MPPRNNTAKLWHLWIKEKVLFGHSDLSTPFNHTRILEKIERKKN